MDSDILKIIASMTKYSSLEDERYNATGEKYLVVGEHDGGIGMVDEYGNVKGLGGLIRGQRFDSYNGEMTINLGNQEIVVKWGVATVDTGLESQTTTTKEVVFDNPFPTLCSTVNVTQRVNDPVTSIMANPKKDGFTLDVTGGLNNETFSYIAIGF